MFDTSSFIKITTFSNGISNSCSREIFIVLLVIVLLAFNFLVCSTIHEITQGVYMHMFKYDGIYHTLFEQKSI